MIEIGFNGSMVGNMKAAAAYNGLFKGDPGGTDILMLEFILDIGFIDNDITSEYRTALPGELYMFRQYDDDAPIIHKESDEEAKASFGKMNLRQWKRFLKDLKICDEVRIWVSNRAESMCGFLFLCSYLEDKGVHIFVVECPKYIPENSKNCFFFGWEQCEPKDLAKYVSLTRELSSDEIHLYSERWAELKKENAPLRALVSNNIISVNEDFYDFLIRKHIPDGEFKQAKIIGDFYDDQISVGSYWLDRRVEYMINSGELEIVTDAKDQYKRILRKSTAN
jgi:hypothetical protein